MSQVSRRRYLQGSLGAMSAAGLVSSAAARPTATRKGGVKFAMMLSPGQTRKMKLARQVGVNHAIAGVLGSLRQVPRDKYYETLVQLKKDYAGMGLTISAMESHPVPEEKIKKGVAGRDEEIENYIAAIDALGKVGIPVLCYNFMAGLGWYRTQVDVPGRGGALVSVFNNEDAKKQGLTEWGEVSEEKMWSNIEYFLKSVIPAAEKANVKMALHPDDPPIANLRGISRICVSAKNYRRIMNIAPSPVNGITFCQANFVAMGEDIEALAREWCGQKKIFFIHFRDIEGTADNFRETFHDNGVTDMAKMLRVYSECGFDGPMRPDHAPTMEGESNENPGYATMGKLWAIGYMKGIMDGQRLPYE